MPWMLSNEKPIYLQLIDQIKLKILAGSYESGDRFPSVRELEQEGLLVGSRTSGRIVTTDLSLIRTMREELAGQALEHFRRSLSELGFSENEILAYIIKEYQL